MFRIVYSVFLLSLVCLTNGSVIGQKIVWQKSIGGSEHDFIEDVIYTRDGGMLITCSSNSGASGDKTEMCLGGFDYWIIKTDLQGEILWQRTIGGDQDDEPITVLETRDGGYLICGESSSGINGNKATAGYGQVDMWVVKLDQKGKTVWQQSYGGSQTDHMVAAFPDPSGGYMLTGYTWVSEDDVKYDSLKGRYDCWLLVINEKGKVMWEETLGGIHDDILTDAVMDHKGNIVLAGYTSIKIPGGQGKKSTERKESGVICISPDKKMLWQKPLVDYGSYSCDKVVVDDQNHYYLGGNIFPGVTKENFSDLLLVVVDENGKVIKDFTLGGSGADFINHIAISQENNLYIGASSASGISTDKSAPSFGMTDGWLNKYDITGKKLWDKTIGGSGLESFAEMLIGPDGSLTVFLQSNSGKTGNLLEEGKGESDIVIVRIVEE